VRETSSLRTADASITAPNSTTLAMIQSITMPRRRRENRA
jgi:hypothetical protein